MDYSKIKAILFDSGHTLNHPRTGNWFLPPRFQELVDSTLIRPDSDIFREAMRPAFDYLMNHHLIRTESEEYEQFRKFYTLLLEECPYPPVTDELINALAWDNVYNDEKFVFFDDVHEVVKKLAPHYQLGIVSDTWPSLERVFVNQGLRPYFSTFVMSSVYGVCKTEPTLFQIALEELAIEPQEALFIDDYENNLQVASVLGIQPLLIDRKSIMTSTGYPRITSLFELLNLLSS